MMKNFGFPEDSSFHPEGWVLFVWIEGQWVYCKIKIDWFYPCHQPLSKSITKVLTLPKDATDFYPKVGEAYNFVDNITKIVPEILTKTNDYLIKLFQNFYTIGINYQESHMETNVLFTMERNQV